MWKFWAILGTLILAGLAYAFIASRPPARPAPVTDTQAGSPTVREGSGSSPSLPTATTPTQPAPVPTPAPAAAAPTPSPAVADTTPAPTTPTVPAEGVPPVPPENSFDALIPTPDTPTDHNAPVIPPAPESKPIAPKLDPDKPLAKFGDFEVLPATITTNPDGSMLVDGKFTIKGQGTAEKPYIIQWDLLTSVEGVFDPSNAKRRLPERITMLDGKHVRISGFVAFPMTSQEPRELLSMLNQWDGCCIGTPPTPYDAIEVALKDFVVGDDRFATTGRVAGTFHVKPYLQGDWLIGLYVMEDATLTPRDFGGAGAN